MGRYSPEYRKWTAITNEALCHFAREGLAPGKLFIHHQIVIFEDTLTIVSRDEPHLPTWWGKPDHFPWVRVELNMDVLLAYGNRIMPMGARIDARVVWRPDRVPYGINLKRATRERPSPPPQSASPRRRLWPFKE